MFPAPIYFIIFLGILSYIFGKNRSKKKLYLVKTQEDKPHYGLYCLIKVTVPSQFFFLLWQIAAIYLINIETIRSIPLEFLPSEDVTLKKLY